MNFLQAINAIADKGPIGASADDFACEEQPGRLTDAKQTLRFITAGNATLTLRSRKSGERFTYRVRTSDDKRLRFVSLLTGADNENSFQYLGHIAIGREVFWHGRKSKISEDAPSAKAFAWTWRNLQQGRLSDQLEVWHEGRCGRCARKLTVPESIESGFGPECIGKING